MSCSLPKFQKPTALLLLVAIGAFGCAPGDSGTEPGPAKVISLVVVSNGGSAVTQGDVVEIWVTLTRVGGEPGGVLLTVSGETPGITITTHDITTTGSVTTAGISIRPDVHCVPGSYRLTLVGTASGFSQAERTFDFTVTPGAPAFRVYPGRPTVAPGVTVSTTVVSIDRINYSDPITLSISDLPPGITASLSPSAESDSQNALTLTLPPTLAVGEYSLLLHAKGAGLPEVTVPVVFTVALPLYTMTLAPDVVTVAPGATGVIAITVARRLLLSHPATVYFHMSLPPGDTAVFRPRSTRGNTSSLELVVGKSASPGTYLLQVYLSTFFIYYDDYGVASAPLILNVTGPVTGNFALRTSPGAAATVVQGITTTIGVNIDRMGGNNSSVALTETGNLPPGMRLSFVPVNSTGDGGLLQVSSTNGTPPGTYPIVIHGNSFPLAEQTVRLDLVVVAPSGATRR